MLPVKTPRSPAEDTTKKKRFLGAGTAAMLIAVMAVVASRVLFPPKVTIERRLEPSTIGMKMQRKPTPADLLGWSAELGLTKTQYAKLKKLIELKGQSLAPINESLKQQTAEFELYMSKQGEKPVALTDIQLHSKPLSDLSFEKRQLEDSFAQQGLAVLSHAQRGIADVLWRQRSDQKKDHRTGGTRVE